MIQLTIEQLNKLSTQRLFNLYKNAKAVAHSHRRWCDCGCGELLWYIYPSLYADSKLKYKYWIVYDIGA